MSEVLIDDSSFNNIANALRQKNGLVRTYKPREMPPAIRALREFVPSTHGHAIRIIQSDNQTITVRVFQDNNTQIYDRSFTVSEPLWKFEATITPDVGWVAGDLNYNGMFSIDRDYVIQAQPATPLPPDRYTTVYIDGSRERFTSTTPLWYHAFSDEGCTQRIGKGGIYGKVNVVDKSNGYPYELEGLFGTDPTFSDIFGNAQEIYQNINTSYKTSAYRAFAWCGHLIRIGGLGNWNLNNITTFTECFRDCPYLKELGDISYWSMPNCESFASMFLNCGRLLSLDMSNWHTPVLRNISSMFSGCGYLQAVDISGWDTTNIQSSSNAFSGCSNLRYIIINSQQMKFTGTANEIGGVIFPNPNTHVKYLVPDNLVESYKVHPNWTSRASQIESINRYTIDKYGGHVYVTPNI